MSRPSTTPRPSCRFGNTGPGPNVLLIEHQTSFAVLDPSKKRDLEMKKTLEALTPKSGAEAKVADFNKFRAFTGTEY